MNLVESVKTCMGKKYATFNGRALRSEFWWFQLFSSLLSVIFIIIDDFYAGSTGRELYFFNKIGILELILTIVLFLPGITVTARRLHDIGLSGWWQIIGLPSYIYSFFLAPSQNLSETDVIFIIPTVIVLTLCAVKSDKNKNKYGYEPTGK